MPNQPPIPRISAYQSPHFAIPAYYNLFPEQPPTHPGWYFCWFGPRADYLKWPGDWSGVTYWVELPPFIQELLQESPVNHIT